MPVSIKEQLVKLVQLQEIDTQIYSLKQENQAKPSEIQRLKSEFEEKKKILVDLDARQKELVKRRKEKELELASKEENVKKFQTQLYSIKTNKEYQVMLKEIDSQKADISVLEEEILKLMEEQDLLKKQVDKEKVNLQEEEKLFNQKKMKIQERMKQIQEELKSLNFKRDRISPEVDKKILSVYERILKNKEGLALAAVKNNSCQGCFMTVTHQVVNEIKMFERLVTCEMCARILYLEEDLNLN